MTKSLHNTVSFSGGEVSPKLDARVDVQKYGTWLRQSLNMTPYKTGGLTRSPGTQKIAACKIANTMGHNYAVRVMPFIFSPDTQFNLEWGNNYLRFYSNGAQVTLSSAPVWITSTNYPAGSFVEDPGDSNNIYYSAAGINGGTTQPHLDSSNWVKQSIYEVPTPYNADALTGSIYTTDVYLIVPCQINDVVYLVHPDFPPYKLTRITDTNWTLAEVEFISPALLDQNATNVSITPSALQGNNVVLVATSPDWVSGNYYTTGQTATFGGVIYQCQVPNVAGTFATDLASGFWKQFPMFNPLHIGSTWQLSTLRQSAYVEYHGSASTGFAAGMSTTIQCLGSYEVHSYGVWSADVAIQRSLDGGSTWDTVSFRTGRSDRNIDIKGTAVKLGIYRIVISNVSVPVSPGATNPRIVFECVDAFLSGLVEITQENIVDASSMVNGDVYQISTLGTTNWGSLGAPVGFAVGTIFSYNGSAVTGSGGKAFQPYDCLCNVVTQLTDSNPLPVQWVSGTAYKFHASAGSIVAGLTYVIVTVGSTDFTLIGASSNTVGVVFTATGSGSGTGTATNMVSYNFVSYTALANVTSSTPPSQDATNWVQTQPGGTQYWSEAAWSNYRGFPRAVTSFQQRVIYGGSGFEPQRIWGTVTNDLENFALGDQTQATDAFAFDLNAVGRGPILWLIAQADLFVGFSGAEWIVNSGSVTSAGLSSGSSITPSNINAVEQGTFGSAPNIQPAIVGNAVFFPQRQSTALRQMLFSVYTAKYMSQDMTTSASHLFASGIVQITYQARWRHQGILWVVTQQGTLCGLTYDLDQEVFGWNRRQTGYGQVDPTGVPITPDNGFESVCVLDGQGTVDDEVWVVANRLIGGVQTRFIERVNPVNWENAFTGSPTPPAPNLSQAFYVDCGITVTNPGSLTISGLSYLNGRYVVGLADGAPFGPLLVSAGSITLPSEIPTTVGTVNVGLPIMYAGQPMRVDSDARVGNTQALIKQISDVFVRVYNSVGGSISNGTTNYPTWISGASYSVGNLVVSPLTLGAFQCVTATSGSTDPSQSASWVAAPRANYQPPVPIPYTPALASPFATPTLVTSPTDIRITPMLMPSPNTDPTFIVQGNDALPVTVLAMILKYDVTASP